MLYISLAVAIAAALLLTVLSRLTFGPATAIRSLCLSRVDGPECLQSISVIVYCCDDPERLAAMLPAILTQSYPGSFEVIVVNDGNSEDVKDVVKILSTRFNNLRLTFIPEQAHSLSRKKLAMTLGAKGAAYPLLIFTTSDVDIISDQWLETMAEPFAHGYSLVLGEVVRSSDSPKSPSPLKNYDELLETASWIAAVKHGKAYRGDHRNMAMRKKLFFENRGFASTLNTHSGIDDRLVSEIAARGTSAVVIRPDVIISETPRKRALRYTSEKRMHIYGESSRSKSARLKLNTMSVCVALLLAATALTVIPAMRQYFANGTATTPCIVAAATALVILIAVWIVFAIQVRKTSKALSMPVSPFWSILWQMVRPVAELCNRIVALRSRRENYTWS